MGLIAVRVLRRARRSGAVRLGMIAMAAGVAVMIVGSLVDEASLVFTLGGVFVVGLGGSLVVNATTATLSTHHPHASAAVVSEGNAVGSTIGLVAPLSVGAATLLSLTWRGGLFLTILLAVAVWLLVGRVHDVPAYAAGPPPATTDATDALPLKYWLIWAALIATIMVETGLVTLDPRVAYRPSRGRGELGNHQRVGDRWRNGRWPFCPGS